MSMDPKFAEAVNEMRTVSKSTQVLLAGFSEDFLARIALGAARDPNSSLAQDSVPRLTQVLADAQADYGRFKTRMDLFFGMVDAIASDFEPTQ